MSDVTPESEVEEKPRELHEGVKIKKGISVLMQDGAVKLRSESGAFHVLLLSTFRDLFEHVDATDTPLPPPPEPTPVTVPVAAEEVIPPWTDVVAPPAVPADAVEVPAPAE